MNGYGTVLDRVEGTCALLAGEDRTHAERVVALARALEQRARQGDGLLAEASDLTLKRELGRLAEVLGRRATQALPAATLGRAALADLAGDSLSARRLFDDCDQKLRMLGH